MNAITATIGLPPTETVKFFKAKGARIFTRHWTDLWQEEHVRAFTVSKINDLNVLNAIYRELAVVTGEGGTLEMFKAALLPELRDAVAAGQAPESILTDRRLRTIYETNLRMARAAGQWERFTKNAAVAPFLMYIAIDDDHTRAQHRIWGGLTPGSEPIILPIDHPAWAYFYPPNGWGCRCLISAFSPREMKLRGLSVTSDERLRAIGWPTSDAPTDIDSTDFERGDGIVERVPLGVDPGFAYNVGKEHLRGLGDALAASLEATAERSVPIARAVLQQVLEQTAIEALLSARGASFPVMILAQAERDLIGAQSAIARLSSDTFAKQAAVHPEIGIAEYRKLVELGAKPDLILKQGDLRLILVKVEGGKWLKATLKATSDGRETYIVSYQFADSREINRLKRINEVVFDAGSN
jgi:hypothetical protein